MRVVCPICQAEYENNPKICSCGYSALSYPVWEDANLLQEQGRAELFAMFKYAKQVYYRRQEYAPSALSLREEENETVIEYVNDRRGLVYVPLHGDERTRKTVADAGMLAFATQAKALILDVDEIHRSFLDESCVKILLLGAHCKRFRSGMDEDVLVPHSGLRYLFVDESNLYFCGENHVLFSKDKRRLISYAPARPEEEYTVPDSVRSLSPYSFYFPRHLKRLYLPRGVRVHDLAFHFDPNREVQVIRI